MAVLDSPLPLSSLSSVSSTELDRVKELERRVEVSLLAQGYGEVLARGKISS